LFDVLLDRWSTGIYRGEVLCEVFGFVIEITIMAEGTLARSLGSMNA
jgi:hypothetical protein